jgi:outer membrane usher protein
MAALWVPAADSAALEAGAVAPGVDAGARLLLEAPAEAPVGSTELYLDVHVNGARGQLARILVRDGVFYATPATLRGLGLEWPAGDTLVALTTLPGTTVEYDRELQRLSLDVPVALLSGGVHHVGYSPRPVLQPTGNLFGVILNYDAYAQHSDGIDSVGAWTEFRVFGVGAGVFSNTARHRWSEDRSGSSRFESVRLDTSWQLDFPEQMISLTVGDAITGSLTWTRPTRIGGIRLARDFGLQPYRITTPLAEFEGEATLPSTVDLLIDGLRKASEDVPPGRFVIDALPGMNGAAQAQLVVTDINGQRRVLDFDFYGTTQLLAPGLADWSLELGKVRRDYGLESFNYDDTLVLSATGRRGLSAWTTIEGHVQASEKLQLAGIGGHWLLGRRGGVLSLAAAGSRDERDTGSLGSFGYQWHSRRLNFSLGTVRRSRGYRDAATVEGIASRRVDQAFVGLDIGMGHLGAGYVRRSEIAGDPSRFATLSWSQSLPLDSTLYLNWNRDLERNGGDSAFLLWSLPLGRQTSLSTTLDHSERGNSISVSAQHSPATDAGGWGWGLRAEAGDGNSGHAEVLHLGRAGQWNAGFDYWGSEGGLSSRTFAFAGASGGLAFAAGHLHALRRVDDAFAIVDTGGIAGVPVKLENRLVGFTDEDGQLLISRLNAWEHNAISIDPLRLPVDMLVDRVSVDAVPRARGAVIASFPMRRVRSVELVLRDAAGQLLPVGTPVWIKVAGSEPGAAPATIVGHDGLVYLQDPPAGASLRVGSEAAGCSVLLPADAGAGGPRSEPVEATCR